MQLPSSFDFASLASGGGGSSPASGVPAGGGFASTIGGGAGAIAGSFLLPGVGTAIGGTVGSWIGGLFSHHGEPNHEAGDVGRIARAAGITDQQAADVCGYEESRSPDNYDAICAKYANNPSSFAGALATYNAAHPSAQIQTGVQVLAAQQAAAFSQLKVQAASAFSGTAVANPFANMTLENAQAAAAAKSMSLGDYAQAIWNGALAGAQKGVTDAVAETPAAQAAKRSYLKDYVKENQALVLLGGFGFVGLIYMAFRNNK